MDAQVIRDTDRDALHIMPLAMAPLETPSLQRARLIKNAKLQSVVELFVDDDAGSGQIAVHDLPQEFKWPLGNASPDYRMLDALSKLPSYDVYSLRITLRQLGIAVEDHGQLQLSDSKKRELTDFMTTFTRPLVREIYGEDVTAASGVEGIIALFRSPDVKQALERLHQMADRLGIDADQVPTFLEDYADIFLSLGYFRNCLDEIEPTVTEFLDALRELRASYQFREDPGMQETTRVFESIVNEAMVGLTGRFEAFDRASKNLWDDISADRFRKVGELVTRFHTTNGGVLCSLSVKMHAWRRHFPTSEAGSPAKRAEIIQSELRQGIDIIHKLEKNAPSLSDLN